MSGIISVPKGKVHIPSIALTSLPAGLGKLLELKSDKALVGVSGKAMRAGDIHVLGFSGEFVPESDENGIYYRVETACRWYQQAASYLVNNPNNKYQDFIETQIEQNSNSITEITLFMLTIANFHHGILHILESLHAASIELESEELKQSVYRWTTIYGNSLTRIQEADLYDIADRSLDYIKDYIKQ